MKCRIQCQKLNNIKKLNSCWSRMVKLSVYRIGYQKNFIFSKLWDPQKVSYTLYNVEIVIYDIDERREVLLRQKKIFITRYLKYPLYSCVSRRKKKMLRISLPRMLNFSRTICLNRHLSLPILKVCDNRAPCHTNI